MKIKYLLLQKIKDENKTIKSIADDAKNTLLTWITKKNKIFARNQCK